MPIVLGPSSLATPPWALTLMDLERELCRRVGPYFRYVARASTAGVIPLIEAASTVQQGGLAGLYLLRRGLMAADLASPETTAGPVPLFNPIDRVRMIDTHDSTLGNVTVDRVFAGVETALGEAVEVMALHPREIRLAVLRGLERSFFVDRVTVTTAAYAAERNLTDSLPWLRDPDWVIGLSHVPTGSYDRAIPAGAWATEPVGGHVWLTVGPDPAPASLHVKALRPFSSWVNGADSTTGPTADADVLIAPLDYAVAMAHDWLWDTAKPRLAPLVTEGMGNSEGEVRSAAARYRSRLPQRADRVVTPTRYRTRLTL